MLFTQNIFIEFSFSSCFSFLWFASTINNSLHSFFTDIMCTSITYFNCSTALCQSSIGESFIIVKSHFSTSSSHNSSTFGSQSAIEITFVPLLLRRAGSKKIIEALFSLCKTSMESLFSALMLWSFKHSKLCVAML